MSAPYPDLTVVSWILAELAVISAGFVSVSVYALSASAKEAERLKKWAA